jgi:hypothetical protein
MKRHIFALAFTFAGIACDPPAPTQTPLPAASQTAQPQTQMPTRNIDVRIEFEPTSDTYGSYISAFLVIPSMGVHVQLFAVPFPYRCERGETDASDELVVRCLGDDGYGSASVRLDGGHVIATARDYGRITADKTVKDLALPPRSTATIFTPPKFPEAH